MKSTHTTVHIESNADRCAESSQRYAWWLYPNLLSLDAPIVAGLWYIAFSRTLGSPPVWSVCTVLFLTVWAIYIADRLFDGLRQRDWGSATMRHHYVHAHQFIFIGLLALILLITAVISLTELPRDLVFAGLGLCVAVALYFTAFVHLVPQLKPLRAKEFACGFVFAAGTVMGVDALRRDFFVHSLDIWPSVLLFAAICIFNCLVITAREKQSDQANDPSAASSWWMEIDRDLMFLGCSLTAISAVLCFLGNHHLIYLTIFISSLLLTLLHFYQDDFEASRSRVLADVALLSPLLFLI